MPRRQESESIVTAGLFRRPEIIVIASQLEISNYEAAGLCLEFWLWVGESCLIDDEGHARLPAVSASVIDDFVRHPGFSDALLAVSWLFVADGSLVVPHFTKHNRPASRASERAKRLMARACGLRESVSACPETAVDRGAKQKCPPRASPREPLVERNPVPTPGATSTLRPPLPERNQEPVIPVPVTGFSKENKKPVTGTGGRDRPLSRVTTDTLRNPTELLRSLVECCADPGIAISDTPAWRVAWFSMAARCLRMGTNPGALFAKSVLSRWWDRCSADDEDRGLEWLKSLTSDGYGWEDVSHFDAVQREPVKRTSPRSQQQELLAVDRIVRAGRKQGLDDNTIAGQLSAAGLKWK